MFQFKEVSHSSGTNTKERLAGHDHHSQSSGRVAAQSHVEQRIISTFTKRYPLIFGEKIIMPDMDR
jgi:hypothetical protein